MRYKKVASNCYIAYKKTVIVKKATKVVNNTNAVNNNTNNVNSTTFNSVSYKQQYAILQYLKQNNVALYNTIVNKQSVINANLFKHYNVNAMQLQQIVNAMQVLQNNVNNKYVNCTSCNNILNKYYKANLNTLQAHNTIHKNNSLYNVM